MLLCVLACVGSLPLAISILFIEEGSPSELGANQIWLVWLIGLL